MSKIEISEERYKIYMQFHKKISSWTFKLFLLVKLPSAFFSGVRVEYLSNEKCETSVPFKWFSQNPFKSTYFACQAMAAELSTGLPAIMAIEKRNPRVSMLVVNMEAEYSKKAVGITIFKCLNVNKILQTVEEAVETGEGKTLKVETIGYNKDNEIISKFWFTWSFKSKS